jgi:hypothetical protein
MSHWGDVGVGQTHICITNVVPVVWCLSAAGPTSIANVEGGSCPSAEPVIPLGNARGLLFPPAHFLGRRAESAVARCAVARILGIAFDIDPLQSPRLADGPRETFAATGGAFLPAKLFVPSGDACGPTFPPVKRPSGRAPDATSQSNVDGTDAQCAVAISIRDVAIGVVGTHPEMSSFPCKDFVRPRGGERHPLLRLHSCQPQRFVTPEDA